MQLWNKQKTFVFANSWRRSRVTLIEKHIKPTCSKITSTTHFVTIRKCNAQNAFFIGIKEMCPAPADNAWLTANPEENSTNYDWMHSLSRTTYGARHGKTEEYHQAWNAWRWCLKKKFEGIHDRFQRDSTSWFETQNWLDWGEVHWNG